MTWLADLIPAPSLRDPLTIESFLTTFLPSVLFYYATAVLVQLHDTFPLRIAILPLTLWSAFRTATRMDLATIGHPQEESFAYLNHGLLLAMVVLSLRVIEWTFRTEPLRRMNIHQVGHESTSSKDWDLANRPTLRNALWNALDLFFNLRGCDWDWSKGLQVPPETRPTTSTSAFLLFTFSSFVSHFILFDLLHHSVQSFYPATIGSSVGGTIIDMTLPFLLRYLCSTTICLSTGFLIYSLISLIYDVCTLIGIIIFRQHARQWPPIFYSPWLSTSLTEFWAKRWHQLFRRSFIVIGAVPVSYVIGRVGGVLGAFLISAILHDVGMWGMGRGSEFLSVGGFFLLNGVGIILEAMSKKFFIKVEGWSGWLWTMTWLLSCAHPMVDAWCRRGLAGSTFLPEDLRPSKYFEALVYRIFAQ